MDTKPHITVMPCLRDGFHADGPVTFVPCDRILYVQRGHHHDGSGSVLALRGGEFLDVVETAEQVLAQLHEREARTPAPPREEKT